MKLSNINKRIRGILIALAAVVITTGFLHGCAADNDCREDLYVQMAAGFHTIVNDTVRAFTIDSLWVKGIGNDSVIYNNAKAVTSIQLPLEKLKDTTRFAIRFNNVRDTLVCVHTNMNKYVSLECGCMTTFALDTLIFTRHKMQKAVILNKNVINKQIENVQIYF
jgi:hypothetical protein